MKLNRLKVDVTFPFFVPLSFIVVLFLCFIRFLCTEVHKCVFVTLEPMWFYIVCTIMLKNVPQKRY